MVKQRMKKKMNLEIYAFFTFVYNNIYIKKNIEKGKKEWVRTAFATIKNASGIKKFL